MVLLLPAVYLGAKQKENTVESAKSLAVLGLASESLTSPVWHFYSQSLTIMSQVPGIIATMSGLEGGAKSAVFFMTKPQNTEKVAQKFTHSTAKSGKPTWPTSQRELENFGFHFDLSDITKTRLDNIWHMK